MNPAKAWPVESFDGIGFRGLWMGSARSNPHAAKDDGRIIRGRLEAKFSALRGRTQKLAQSLADQAEVLPAVIAQVELAESVFKAAASHSVAFVSRNELNSCPQCSQPSRERRRTTSPQQADG